MALYLIGIGLNDEKDISLKGLEIVKKCDFVYLENYTAVLNSDVSSLERLYGKKIILADRDVVEKEAEKTILKNAKNSDVAFLVVGDPLAATTHIDLILRAKNLGIKYFVINNASILTAIGITGLQLYKFGRIASIPFPENVKSENAYNVTKENQKNDLHTLLLLDLNPSNNDFMTIKEAIKILLEIENKRKENIFTEETKIIGCARLGSFDYKIKYGTAKELMEIDFGSGMKCLIVPSKKLHFMEEEMLRLYL